MKTPELLNEILRRVGQGDSVLSICRDDGMPNDRTVWGWMHDDEQFARDYTRALTQRSLVHADRIDDVVKRALAGEIPSDVARVAIDAAKWTASRLLPKIYGERQEVSVDVKHTHVMHLEALRELSDAAKRRREGQVIDITAIPTVDLEVLELPAPSIAPAAPAEPELLEARAARPPRPRPPRGAATVAAPPPTRQNPRKGLRPKRATDQ